MTGGEIDDRRRRRPRSRAPTTAPGGGEPPAPLYTFVSLGNPHCVVEADDPDVLDLAAVGAPIERHPWFPNRTNVEFYRPLGGHEIRMRVWERGAGETLSSGSGSTAAAVAAVVAGRAERPVTVHPDGGYARRRGRRRPRRPADRPGRSTSTAASSQPTSRPRWRRSRCAIASARPALPPYLFAELERKIAERRRGGGRRDLAGHRRSRPADARRGGRRRPQRQVARPDTHQYPSNRGRAGVPRGGGRVLQAAASASTLDPETEVLPLLGGKEGVAHVCFVDARPRRRLPGGRPRLPGLHLGDAARGRGAGADAADAREHGFQPDLEAIPAAVSGPRQPALLQLPQQPDRRRLEDRLLRAAGAFGLEHERPDRARQRLLRDHVRRLRGAELPAGARARARPASRCSRSRSRTT